MSNKEESICDNCKKKVNTVFVCVTCIETLCTSCD